MSTQSKKRNRATTKANNHNDTDATSSKQEIIPATLNNNKNYPVNVAILKRFSPGCWYPGVVTSLPVDAVVKKGTAKDATIHKDHVVVNFQVCDTENDTNFEQLEALPRESLDHWIVAHTMLFSGNETSKLVKNSSHEMALFHRPQNTTSAYSLEEFIKLLTHSLWVHGGTTIEQLEGSPLVQAKANSKGTEVYGRMLPGATDKVIKHFLNLKPGDRFLDIGHGIGNSCLQAAYTVGCDAYGIECDESRNAVAQVLAWRMEDAAHLHKSRDKMEFTPGSVTLRHGNLEDPQHREFLTEQVTHIFFDNYNGVFNGERGNGPNLERYIAALFAMAPEGTVMTTVSPLRAALGCLPLSEANEVRKRQNLPVSDNASFYDVEVFELGPLNEVYSFAGSSGSQFMVNLYRYVRTKQSTTDGKACFLCNNLRCEKAKNGATIAAIHFENSTKSSSFKDAAVIGSCPCGMSDRVLRRRKP